MVNPGQKLELQHMVDLADAASTSGVPETPYYFRPRIHVFRVSDSDLQLPLLPDVAVGHLAVNTMTLEMWVLDAYPASDLGNWSVASNWVVVATIAARNALTPTNGLNVYVVNDTTPISTRDPHNHYVWRAGALPAAVWVAYGDWGVEFFRLIQSVITTGTDYRLGQRLFSQTGPYVINNAASFTNGVGSLGGSLGPKYYSDLKWLYPTNEASGRNLTSRIDPEVTNYDDGEYFRGGFTIEDVGDAALTGGMAVQLASNSGSSFVLSGSTASIAQQTIQSYAGPIYYLELRFADDIADGEFYIGIKPADGFPALPSGVWRTSFLYGGPIVTLENVPLSNGTPATGLHAEAGLSELALPDPSSYPLTGATSPTGVAAGQNTGRILYALVPAPSVRFLSAKTPPLQRVLFNRERGPFQPLQGLPALAPYARLQSPTVPDEPTDPIVSVGVYNAIASYPVVRDTEASTLTYTGETWGSLYCITVARLPVLNVDNIWVPDTTGEELVVDIGEKIGGIFRTTGQVTIPALQASVTVWPTWPIRDALHSLHYRASQAVVVSAAVVLGQPTAPWFQKAVGPFLADHYNGWLATVEAY